MCVTRNLLEVTWSKFLFPASPIEDNNDKFMGSMPVVERNTRWELYALVYNLACVDQRTFSGLAELPLKPLSNGV
jgi:hypothetical protein